LAERRKNAQYVTSLFREHPFIQIQDEVSASSWFGFSLVLKEGSPLSRSELVSLLKTHNIECRPIVTGNFLKN
jgi:dTDP-4-amino-4,6-dideoxygalactose transaminase